MTIFILAGIGTAILIVILTGLRIAVAAGRDDRAREQRP